MKLLHLASLTTYRFIRKSSFSVKMSPIVKIATHDGCFHADEALACFMLKKLPEYKNAEIVRTRDQSIIETCDIVVDVGGVYGPSKHRYDHHQNTFKETIQTLRPELTSSVRLSSAGLIYHHFGERVFEAVLGKQLDKNYLRKLFSYVYFHFMEEIDAVDNGIPMYDQGVQLYSYHTSLSSRVGNLHPVWNAPNREFTPELFEKAMEMTGKEFLECVHRFSDVWWPARTLVQEAMDKRFEVHPSGEIIQVPLCPWLSHVFDIEKEQNIEGVIKFAIWLDGESCRVRAVPENPGSFRLRVPLHPSWHGLRDEQLQVKSGVADAAFIHNTGFIGGAKSKEGALALADKSLKS